MPAKKKTVRQTIQKAVSRSSKMEGLSLNKAKKNTSVINKLKKYGRAFSI